MNEVNAVVFLSGNLDKSRQRTLDVPQSEAAAVKMLDEADQNLKGTSTCGGNERERQRERVVFDCKRYLLPHLGRF